MMTATFLKLLFWFLSSDQVFNLLNKCLDNYKSLSPEQINALKKRFEDIE